MRLGRVPIQVLVCVAIATSSSVLARPALAYVALMSGQKARPLNGAFNRVPVLHSNQPEIVKGPGILVTTAPGTSIAAESNRPLRNATYTFNGDFGVHMHHKYYPTDSKKLGGRKQRGLLTLGLIAINPGDQPVTLTFSSGSVKNSFEAPYLPNNLMGVKPLGKRPWNTGPGDATAVQMLREELDRKLRSSIVIPARSRRVVISTDLPARGIANGLLQGFELRLMHQVGGNLLGEHVEEHGFQVVIRETGAVLVLDSLPGTNPPEHEIRSRAFRESMKRSDALQCHLRCSALMLLEQSAPELEPVILFAPGEGHTMGEDVVGHIAAYQGPQVR